jgi:hypothetical protein
MSAVILVKNPSGHLEGFGQKGAKVYAKFLAACKALEIGETLSFSYKVPRSGPFHRRHFAMLNQVFDAQEQFASDLDFRKWTEVGAGHVLFVPGPTGRMVALPRSIAYDELDQADFEDLHEKVKAFLRSRHATAFLWPHLDESQQMGMIEQLLVEFQ